VNVLVIGKGGRENALCWKLKQSPQLSKLYTIPKNSIFEMFSYNVDVNPFDFERVKDFCIEHDIKLVVVGPEDYLSKGISDYLSNYGISVFGPKLQGAILESSKQVAKEFMQRNYIPTAEFKVFTDPDYAKEYIKKIQRYPIVIKADGLCAGKGVRIVEDENSAFECVDDFMVKKIFGTSSSKIIIEEYLRGREVSVLCLVDGKRYLILPLAKDHKRLLDGDKGPNTGGMGSYCPFELCRSELSRIEEEIIWRFMDSIIREKIDYRGVIYFGLIITDEGPKVLEFNVRFGDPETQSILPLIDDDILEIFYSVARGKMLIDHLNIKKEYCVCVVASSSGYPFSPKIGDEINGLDKVDNDVIVFFAGARYANGKYYTDGGRVLNVVACDKDFEKARRKVYDNISKINFSGMHFRKDIGILNKT
jgi:phosphoribosylamine--glycine ligase